MNNLMTKSFATYFELKKQALKDHETSAGGDGRDLEAGGLSRAEEDNLAPFFVEVDALRSQMNDVCGLLVELHEASKSVHSSKEAIRGVWSRTGADITAILRKAEAIKANLAALNRRLHPEGGPVDRTRTSVANDVRAKLRELMQGFQALRESILAEHIESLERRHFDAAATGEEEAVEKVLDEMLVGGSQMEDEESGQDMQRILTELHQIFLGMAAMVETQEEGQNNIEEHVGGAEVYICGGGGKEELAVAHGRTTYAVWALLAILVLVCMVLLIKREVQ